MPQPPPSTTILIVEDDMIVGTHISMVLVEAGYEVSGVIPSAEAALRHLEVEEADLVLMDINLKGKMDGIEAAQHIYERHGLPVIFLTANSDAGTFQRAKQALPYAFLNKPFQPEALLQAIELAAYRSQENPTRSESVQKPVDALDDRIFVRDKDKMMKISLEDIHYVKAERNYCTLITSAKSYTLSIPLKSFEEKVSSDLFCRVHRSFLVNLKQVESLDEHHVFCSGEAIPLSKAYKKELNQRLNVL